jgi:hypothetical protein
MRASPKTHARRHELGILFVGGDWACAHGDLAGLADVAKRLGACTDGPIRAEALAVARLCYGDQANAVKRWLDLRTRMHDRTTAMRRSQAGHIAR